MARCAYCNEETEIYIGGDVPICTECLDAHEAKRNTCATGDLFRNTLLQEFPEAMALSNEATREFEAAMAQSPGRSQHTAGAQRITIASRKLSTAREGMMTAHNRLNDHLDHRIVREESIAAHDSPGTT